MTTTARPTFLPPPPLVAVAVMRLTFQAMGVAVAVEGWGEGARHHRQLQQRQGEAGPPPRGGDTMMRTSRGESSMCGVCNVHFLDFSLRFTFFRDFFLNNNE